MRAGSHGLSSQRYAGPGIPLKLVQREPTHGEQAKALACFGALRHDTRQVELYFAPGQPKSEPMGVFLMGFAFARQEGKRVLVVIWGNARWHKSARIRQWIHNRENALANHACLLICIRRDFI